MCGRWKDSTSAAKCSALRRYHLAPGSWHKAPTPVGDGAFRRLAAKVDLELLARVAAADCAGRGGHHDCSAMDWFLDRARALGVQHAPPAPLLMGRHLLDLGIRPGPGMGELLKQVYERQLDGDVQTLDDALAEARRLIAAQARPSWPVRARPAAVDLRLLAP